VSDRTRCYSVGRRSHDDRRFKTDSCQPLRNDLHRHATRTGYARHENADRKAAARPRLRQHRRVARSAAQSVNDFDESTLTQRRLDTRCRIFRSSRRLGGQSRVSKRNYVMLENIKSAKASTSRTIVILDSEQDRYRPHQDPVERPGSGRLGCGVSSVDAAGFDARRWQAVDAAMSIASRISWTVPTSH
jgi:hypothetical protein